MTILGYAGLPGSGKSYSVVENVIVPALKAGRTVVHNLKLKEDEIALHCDGKGQLVQIPADATADELVKLAGEDYPGSVVAIDEIWNYWPAGIKTNELPKAHLSFFKEHRHRLDQQGRASEIVVIDQDMDTSVAGFIRRLIKQTFVHIKLDDIGANSRFRVEIYNGCVSPARPIKSRLLRKMMGRYRPEIFGLYYSQTKSDESFGSAGLETIADGRGNIWKSWQMRAAIGALFFSPFVIWKVADAFTGIGSTPDAVHVERPQRSEDERHAQRSRLEQTTIAPQNAVEPSPRIVASTPAIPPKPPKPKESSTWTLTGVMRYAGNAVALISKSGAERRIPLDLCDQDSGGEWICMLDGEQIATWTGQSWRMYARASTYVDDDPRGGR